MPEAKRHVTLLKWAFHISAFVIGVCGQSAKAATAPADMSVICDQAASEASRRTGVPVSVLRAISLTETGRTKGGAFRPWPWTVNMEGKGLWFDNLAEARTYVEKEYNRGARSFDVGCFQINYKWHGAAFASIDDMFDPLTNALYAAQFLGTLFAEKQTWAAAAGAYHSRNATFADKYQSRFERIHQSLKGAVPAEIPDIPEIPDIVLAMAQSDRPIGDTAGPQEPRLRINHFPLLQAGGQNSLGSLVPIGIGGSVPLFGAAFSHGID